MPNTEAARLIAALELEPLPHEGGFFRRTWGNAAGSAIYFLLTPEDFSAFHRLRTDEVWHFYAGDPVEHVQLGLAGPAATVARLGADVLGGEVPQLVAHAGAWQGARLAMGANARHGWALVGCTMAPPWDEETFELGEAGILLAEFPAAAEWVRALTRSG